MKINYEINWVLIRLPILPWLKVTKIEPEEPEAEILPIPAQTPAAHVSDGRSYPNRKYDPDTRYRRGTGPLKGTERYRATHVKRDLIQWFTDRKNRPLTEKQMRTMKKSPFRHAWVKCELTCEDRIVSDSTLRRVLRDRVTFARAKRGKFTLDKDFYKSLTKKTDTLAQIAESIPVITPPVQVPTETETEEVSHADVVRAYVRENSDIRR